MKYKTDAIGSDVASVCAVIVCAGKGERTGLAYNKVLHCIGKKTVLEMTLDTFADAEISHVTVVCSPSDIDSVKALISAYPRVSIITGGATRSESVFNGLKAYPCDIAVIHDGARPFASKDLILRAVRSAKEYGSGIAAVRSIDTVKRVGADGTVNSLPRSELYNVQTPQAFRYEEILKAYTVADGEFTDDSEVYAAAGFAPRIVEGEYSNIKITTARDLVQCVPSSCRIGIGFDIHRLVTGRPLILGGVKIDHDKGLDGHSDADVLIHAVMDALLSAAELPDIGVLFPDTDDRYLDIASTELLHKVTELVREQGLSIGNVSAVVIAQKPKLAPYILSMRASLADVLGIDISRVNVSATTAERLGLIGNGDAIASDAACILTENGK